MRRGRIANVFGVHVVSTVLALFALRVCVSDFGKLYVAFTSCVSDYIVYFDSPDLKLPGRGPVLRTRSPAREPR